MYTYRLINDVIAIRVASMVMLWVVMLFRINHFGINPESGGSPPSDSIVVDSIIMVWGELVHIVPISLIVVEVVMFISISVGVVAMVYTINVSIEISGAIVMVARIHPVWAIDEKAISFRSCVWFRLPRPPIVIDRIAAISISVMLVLLWVVNRIVIGAIFCQVRMVRVVMVVVPCDTSGSQKWNGAAAIFIIRAKVMIVVAVGSIVMLVSQFEVFNAFVVAAISIAVEAIVCVR